jgi:hypothetical protein
MRAGCGGATTLKPFHLDIENRDAFGRGAAQAKGAVKESIGKITGDAKDRETNSPFKAGGIGQFMN